MEITRQIAFATKANPKGNEWQYRRKPFSGQVLFAAHPLEKRVEKHYPAVVVGGGNAGLVAMYDLVKRRGIPAVLLEAGKRLGGNCNQGESPSGIPHSAGATIFLPGNENHRILWKELGLDLRREYLLKPEIFVYKNGERFTAFGTKEDLAEFKPQTEEGQRAARDFLRLLKKIGRIFARKKSSPVIPIQNAKPHAFGLWDKKPFSELSQPYGPMVYTMADKYLQSDLAAPSDASSSYVAMNDLGDLLHDRYVFPRGNADVVTRLKEEINRAAGSAEPVLQLSKTVEQVEQDKDKVYLKYRGRDGSLHVISADTVLMAAPYNQVPRLMKLPDKVASLMTSLPRSSYSIVNLYLNKTPLKTRQFYMLPESKLIADLYVHTDEAEANHKADPEKPSVMSIYIPHTGRRKNLKAFEKEVVKDILTHFPEIQPEMIDGVNISQFKYSMASPKPGQVKKLREMPRTFGNVTLINSDGGAIPSILTAVDEAMFGVKTAVKQLIKKMDTRSQSAPWLDKARADIDHDFVMSS